MAHPDHEKYRDRRLNLTVDADIKKQIDRERRFRRQPIEDPQDHPEYPPAINLPIGFSKGDGAQTFQPVSSTGYARYIGPAPPRINTLKVMYRITTAAVTVTYAEIGLCFSEFPDLASSIVSNTLTLVPDAWVDIASVITAGGRKLATISSIGEVNVGAHLWILLVVQATTTPVMRGGIPQEAGLMMSKAGSARPSTLAPNAPFDEVATSVNDIWLPHSIIQS